MKHSQVRKETQQEEKTGWAATEEREQWAGTQAAFGILARENIPVNCVY